MYPLEPSLYRYIWRATRAGQVRLLGLTIVSFGFLYLSLELPKIIVNDAIKGTGFPRILLGHTFSQTHWLWLLCGGFLLAVLINGAFKYVINVYRGVLAERTVLSLRKDLFGLLLATPIARHGDAAGQYIPSVTSEVDPVGGCLCFAGVSRRNVADHPGLYGGAECLLGACGHHAISLTNSCCSSFAAPG
jgi:putative ABC transport system ATP-binding protein